MSGTEYKKITLLDLISLAIGTKSSNSIFTALGSVCHSYVAKIADYIATEFDYTIDCIANSFTVTLPSPTGVKGRIYNIKNSGTGINKNFKYINII